MDSRNIREMRKNGYLFEAYALSKELLTEVSIEDVWFRRDVAWVCYDLLKESLFKRDEAFSWTLLQDLYDLNLPASDIMLGNSVAWLLGKHAELFVGRERDTQKQEQKLTKLVTLYMKLPKEVPGKGHSFFVSKIHKLCKAEWYYHCLIIQFGLHCFEAADYAPVTLPNSTKMMSLVEQVYIAFSKSLLQNLSFARNSADRAVLHRSIQAFLPSISKLIETHPEYLYPLYYKAKLLLALQENEQAILLLRSFAKAKSKDYWVWHLLGEALEKDNKLLALACYCRGLLCNSRPEMMVALREDAALLMESMNHYIEARTELELSAQIRMQKWGRVSKIIEAKQREAWYRQTTPQAENRHFYKKYAPLCEEFLLNR